MYDKNYLDASDFLSSVGFGCCVDVASVLASGVLVSVAWF